MPIQRPVKLTLVTARSMLLQKAPSNTQYAGLRDHGSEAASPPFGSMPVEYTTTMAQSTETVAAKTAESQSIEDAASSVPTTAIAATSRRARERSGRLRKTVARASPEKDMTAESIGIRATREANGCRGPGRGHAGRRPG